MLVEGPNGLRVEFPDGTDPQTINKVMSEMHARTTGRTPQQPAQPPQRPVDATPPQSGWDKFVTGFDRLPNLVGIGNISSGFTKADVSPEEAVKRFGQGSAGSLQAAGRAATGVLGPVDDWVIAGVSEALTNDAETFDQKVKRSEALADQLREDHPLASLYGDVAGFGYAGKALRGVAASRGLPIVGGVAGEAATITALHGAAEGQSADQILQDAATAAIFGKVLQGVGDKVVAPAAKFIAPRIERAFASKAAKATDEFKIPEHEVQRIADRLKMPVEDVRAGLDDYLAANGVDGNILSVVNADTAAQWEKLARSKKGAAEALRAGEEQAALARPDIVAGAVRRTGDSQTASEAIGAVEEAGAREAGAVKRTAQDQMAETRDIVTAQKRIETANQNAARALADQQIAEVGDELATTLQRGAQGIETDANVEAALTKYTTQLLRSDGGLAQQPVRLTPEWIKANLPGNPKRVSAVLKDKADALPEGAQRSNLLKAAEDIGLGKEVNLTIGDVDNVRRALIAGGQDAVTGAKWSLSEAGNALRREAARQVPDYAEKYLKVFAGTKRGLAARDATKMILGKGGNDAAANVQGTIARITEKEGADAAVWVREGARDGALRAIAQASRDGEEALKAASNIIRNSDAIVRTAGAEGQRLVTAVNQTMENVARLRDDMADIVAEAGRNKNILTDGMRKRLDELKRAASTQIAGIKAAIRRDTGALRAAQKVLSTNEGEFAAATAGSKQNLGSVARGSIADEAGSSPASAIKVVEDIATPSQARKIEKVAGADTAKALQAVGRTQTKAIANLNKAAARTKDDGGLGEELSTAIEAAASLAGRAGPGYATAVAKRGIQAFQHFGISNRGAKAIANAVLNNDAQYVARLINRLAKTERQRKVLTDAVRSFLLGLNVGNVTSAR